MQTISTSSKKKKPNIIIKTKKPTPSYAPIGLAALLVIIFFATISIIVATDDVAAVVSTIDIVGYAVGFFGALLGIGVLLRRGKPLLGLGVVSAFVLIILGAAVVQAGPTFSGPAHFAQGQQAIANQNYERAIGEYRLARNPDYLQKEIPEAYLRWGDQLAKTGNFEQALVQYSQVLSDALRPNPYENQIPDARAKTLLAWAEKTDKDNARAQANLTTAQKVAFETTLMQKYDQAIKEQPSVEYINRAKSGIRNILYRQAEDLKIQNKYEELESLYQKVYSNYLDGKPQALAEVELRQATNFLEWSRKLSSDNNYNNAITYLKEAEKRFVSYDPRRVETVAPDMIANYSKLAPELIGLGKYEETIERLSQALKDYGSKDTKNLLAQALLSSYLASGDDLEADKKFVEARERFKTSLELNDRYKFNNARPRQGVARTYLAQAQAAEAKADFPAAIAFYREGLSAKYFNVSEVTTATASISRSYLGWAEQYANKNEFDNALNVYRDGLKDNQFVAADKNRALDAGGEIFLKRGQAAEAKSDWQGAVNAYAALASDSQFKDSATGRNLINLAPKVNFALADQYLKEAGGLPKPNVDKINTARELLQNIANTYGSSEFAKRSRDIINAPIEVVGKLLNNAGQAVGNRPIRFSTEWKFCKPETPDDDPDCKGAKEGFIAKGEVLSVTTAPDGGWSVRLAPNKAYLFSWQERGSWTSVFVGDQAEPGVYLKTQSMIPINYEYRTPTDAPQ